MKISLVVPSRNNIDFFKWMYASVRKNQGDHEVFICAAADACIDGTNEYFEELAKQDDHFKYIINKGPERKGLVFLYNEIVKDLVQTEIAMIWHSDMYLAKGALDALEKHLKPKTIVSLTRIEPPLHPDGPEKLVINFGIEPKEFNEEGFENLINNISRTSVNTSEFDDYLKKIPLSKSSRGVFAPWAFYVEDFNAVGGHDLLFMLQSRDDNDIWNRLLLNGCDFIQTWEGFVYHMTCRGSRFNPLLTNPGTNSIEWEKQNYKSTRNFIRKWGSMVKHDEYIYPIVLPKREIGIVLWYDKSIPIQILESIEPFATKLYLGDQKLIDDYIKNHQPLTPFDLSEKINTLLPEDKSYPEDYVIHIDLNTFNDQDFFYITEILTILNESEKELGVFQVGNLVIEVNRWREIEVPNKIVE